MTTYRVEPNDDDGHDALWRERENGVLEAVATLADGQTRADEGHWPDHGVVFRAAAAVLAPDEAATEAVARGLCTRWHRLKNAPCAPHRREAQEALRTLRAHVEEATP